MTVCEVDAKSVFLAALERLPDELSAFLDQACGGNSQLRSRVDQLLCAHQAMGRVHGYGADAPQATADELSILESPGTAIGPYKLLEQIGEGGFGVVFMAEQTQPIHRKVALKIIKPGMDTQQVIARFAAERQALALMDHTNIARVLDAGATESGRPYFVMELVRGVPVTEFCDRHQLPIRERLELFVTVCQAVQHAHQKGIIHRDLKPTNVLVTSHDGRPVVKIIDFGVAKAVARKLTEKTLFTGFAQLIGTPLYMSPEQAEMSGLDVDTRSDIYSLGVLLYELLTGSTPFDSQRLKMAAFDEMRRIIREEEPLRPSTQITTLAQQTITTVCAQRNIEPQHLNRLFQGELDWIVMKSLEKDRTRRYETASALAADVEHYLRDEPVQACPPSAMYRFRKYARRHKAVLVTAAVLLAALIVGTVVSSWQAIRAFHAEAAESAQRQQAETNAQRVEEVSKFLVNAFRNANPERNGRTITTAELLDRAAKELQTKFADDPLTKAELLDAIAESYQGLGLYREELPLLEQARDLRTAALGPDHHDALSTMDKLIRAYEFNGRFDDEAMVAEQALKLTRAKLGPVHPDTLGAMIRLACAYISTGRWNEAVELDEETVKLRRATLGPDHPDTLNAMGELANHYLFVGRYNESLRLNEETLRLKEEKLGTDDLDTLAAMEYFAEASYWSGRLDDAVSVRKRLLELSQVKLGSDHLRTLGVVLHLINSFRQAGRSEEAARLGEDAIELTQAKLGQDHPVVLAVMSSLAAAYSQLGRHDEAIGLLEKTFKIWRDKQGPDHFMTQSTMDRLADAYQLAGRMDDSIALRVEVLRLLTPKLGSNCRESMLARNRLGLALLQQGKLIEAETVLKEDLTTMRTNLSANDLGLSVRLHNLALALILQSKFAEAEPLARESLEIRRKNGGDEWQQFSSRSLLGGALLGQKMYLEAEPMLVSGYEGLHERVAAIPATQKIFLKQSIERLVSLYEATNQLEKKAEWNEKLANYEKAETKKPITPSVN